MKKPVISKKQLCATVTWCVTFISFVFTVLPIVHETRGKVCTIFLALVVSISVVSCLVAYHSSKTAILNRALENIFADDMPLITTTQYAYYASQYIRNPHIKLIDDALTVKITRDPVSNDTIQNIKYSLVGMLKGKKSVEKIEAIFSKQLLENFHDIELKIIRHDSSIQPRINFVQKDSRRFEDTNYRTYEINLGEPLTKDSPSFNIDICINYKTPIPFDFSNIFFMDPTNFASKTKNLKMIFLIDAKDIIEEYDIITYKLNKRTLKKEKFKGCKLIETVQENGTYKEYCIDFKAREHEQKKRLSKERLYLAQIVKRRA